MSEQNKQLVRQALHEVFAAGNLAAVDDIFHHAFVNHEAGPDTPPGPEGLKVTVSWIRSSFSDLSYEIQDEIAEADKVVVRVMSRGRHTGEFMGFPATGKTFAAKQIHIYRIAEGKIIEHWSCRDDLAQGMQLGMIPAGRSVGDAPRSMAGPPVQETPPSTGSITGKPLAKASEIPVGGGKILAEDHVVITQPTAGSFRIFSSTCTHLGCTVGQVSDGMIQCPCHGSRFDMADGSVRRGPAARPLPRFDVVVQDGLISAVASATYASSPVEQA